MKPEEKIIYSVCLNLPIEQNVVFETEDESKARAYSLCLNDIFKWLGFKGHFICTPDK